MPSSVDNRVVSMTFDNESFERKLSETIKSLDKLRESLDFSNASASLDDLSQATSDFDTSNMAAAIDSINSKLSTLGAIGFSAIQHITEGVLGLAGTIADKFKGDILAPVLSGGKQRAGNIEQAKFMFRGIGIDVQKGMDDALAAVKGTAFGLDEAAKAAAQFGASGIKVGKEMSGALRGVAGAAAMTGSSFTEIADIFAGSAGTGKVTNQDLMQFATRGLNAAAAIGKVMNKTEAQIHEMATEGQLDFKTFAGAMDKAFGEHATKANQTYAGSLANVHAAMSRMGAAFFTDRLVQQRDLFNAISPAIDNMTKALDPLFKTILGITRIGTDKLIKFINGIDFKPITTAVKIIADAVSIAFHVIQQFSGAIKQAFKDVFPPNSVSLLIKVAEIIRKFVQYFVMSGPVIEKVKDIFRGLFAIIEIGGHIIHHLFFLLAGLVKIAKDFINTLFPGNKGLLVFAGHLGDLAVKLNEALIAGGGLARFFIRVQIVINKAAEEIHNFAVGVRKFIDDINAAFNKVDADGPVNKVKQFFDKFSDTKSSDDADKTLGRIQQRFEQLTALPDKVSASWDRLQDRFKGVFNVLDKITEAIKTFFGELGDKIAEAFKPGDFDSTVDLFNAGLLGGIYIILKKFIDGGAKLDFLGLRDRIEGLFDAITEKTQAMTTSIKADTLIKIAAAIAILTASMVVLSLIDSVALTKALIAMTVGFGQLVGVMKLMDEFISGAGAVTKVGVLSVALLAMSTSMVILAAALKILSTIDPGDLAKGLYAVGVGLGEMVLVMRLMTKGANPATTIAAAAGLVLVAISLNILAGAIAIFAQMSPEQLAKGFISIGIGLGIIVAALKVMGTTTQATLPLVGQGLIFIGIALNLIAGAVAILGSMSIEQLAKGIIGMGLALAAIGLAVNLMPQTLPLIAPAILALAAALALMVPAIVLLGSQGTGTIVKGVAGLATILLAIAAATFAMSFALPGAQALIIVSAALLILAGVLKIIGDMKITSLITGMVAIVGVILLLAGVSALITPLIPAMIGLGIALVALGLGFTAIGLAIFLFASGLEILARSGVAGIKVLVSTLPTAIGAFIKAMADQIGELLKAIPLLVRLIQALLEQVLETIIKLAPKLGKALVTLVLEALKAFKAYLPALFRAGLEIVLAILKGIKDNIPKFIGVAVDIMLAFIGAVVANFNKILDAGIQLIGQFFLGIIQRIGEIANVVTMLIGAIVIEFAKHVMEMINLGVSILGYILQGITDNMVKIINMVANIVMTFIVEMGKKAIEIAAVGTTMLVAFINAIADDIPVIAAAIGRLVTNIIKAVSDLWETFRTAGTDALKRFLEGIGKSIGEIATTAVELVGKIVDAIVFVLDNSPELLRKLAEGFIRFLNGVADVIRKEAKPLGEAMANVAEAIIGGFSDALISALKKLAHDELPGPLADVASAAIDVFKGSPIERGVFYKIGQKIMVGFSNGLSEGLNKSSDVVTNGSNTIVTNMNKTMSRLSNSLGETKEFNPVITPVLDLTRVQDATKGLNSLIQSAKITPEVSLNTARTIATTADLTGKETATTAPEVIKEIKFEQNITSPTALSTNDIYKNTKSQIALAKEELGLKS